MNPSKNFRHSRESGNPQVGLSGFYLCNSLNVELSVRSVRLFMFRYIAYWRLWPSRRCWPPPAASSERRIPQSQPQAPAPPASEEVRIGNEIGNRLPNFELTLTDSGEKLTSTSLVESGRPAFLFFFATT